jgi:hypothetical protein
MHRMQWRSRLTHYDVRPFRKVSYSQRGRLDYVGQSEDGWTGGADWIPAEPKNSSEVKSAVNGLQNARLEGLTRLPTASRVKVRDNERKKDSDRPALEKE